MAELTVRLQPRAHRDEVVGERDGVIVIRVIAPPVDGKANAELIALVAERFGCRKNQVTIKAGAGGRMKLVRIDD